MFKTITLTNTIIIDWQQHTSCRNGNSDKYLWVLGVIFIK